MPPHVTIWIIAALATAGVILRPFAWPEAVWAAAGAVLLILLRLVSPAEALAGAARGTDVYLFLLGMMLLAETARENALFEWLASIATSYARGYPDRLFLLTYCVGTVVTVFLSNDATAVVLTPAVAAAARAAQVAEPLPYLLICAFIANAASFVLPISNPANLVIYGRHLPALLHWLPAYALPSLLAIVATYVALRWTQSRALRGETVRQVARPHLSGAGKAAAAGIAATVVVLLTSSALDVPLGLPTAIAGAVTAAGVTIGRRHQLRVVLKNISWSVIVLVAGLFVLVEGLEKTGLIATIVAALNDGADHATRFSAWIAGLGVAVASNVINNLPAGLIAGGAVRSAHGPEAVTRAILIGVDVGPNLSVTGSLATILWLAALRREGHTVGFGTFLRLGLVVMPPALVLAMAAALLVR